MCMSVDSQSQFAARHGAHRRRRSAPVPGRTGAPAPADVGEPADGRPRPRLRLTDLDVRLLEGIAAGASTGQLARRLHLSEHGVTYHVTAMFRQLQVPNRTALVAKAYALGLFTAGSWPPRVAADAITPNGQRTAAGISPSPRPR